MFRLGLTGSIATGKSTVLALFEAAGIPTYSADQAVHELYDGPAVDAVEKLFQGVTENGRVDRQKLGARVLENPENLQKLEALIHPMARARMGDFLEECEKNGTALAVLEIPLLFETGHPYALDGVAVTYCDPAIQRQRALARPGMTVEKLHAILARQLPQADKKAKADFVINTGTTIEDTRKDVAAIIQKCLQAGSDKT
jgi:dephospho-CoA kinase